jgi:hypothetical protein
MLAISSSRISTNVGTIHKFHFGDMEEIDHPKKIRIYKKYRRMEQMIENVLNRILR